MRLYTPSCYGERKSESEALMLHCLFATLVRVFRSPRIFGLKTRLSKLMEIAMNSLTDSLRQCSSSVAFRTR